MARSSLDRDDSSPHITELVFEDPEATSVQTVKHSLSEKEGIPSRQRRLSFPLSSSDAWHAFPDQIRRELHRWQAIVYANGKPLGRLVQPSFAFRAPQDSVQSFEFTFSTFRYAAAAKGAASDPTLAIPVDTAFVSANFAIQLFGRCGSESLALPFRYRVSGKDAAAQVSLHQQRVAYIQKHKEQRRKELGCDPNPTVPPVQEIAIPCELHKESVTSSKNKMEVVHAKTKDFCKDSAIVKANMNRGKKKQKKPKKIVKNGTGGDRLYSHDYTAVPSNRHRSSRLGPDSFPDQNSVQVVEKILHGIQFQNCEQGGEEKLSDVSALGGETSHGTSSPENPGQISPTKSGSDGLVESEARRMAEEEAKKKDLTFSINDFELEEVYIRRNQSVESLVRSGSGIPAVSGAPESKAAASTGLPSQLPEPPKPADRQGWRQPNGLVPSPATSSQRLNFRSANALLQSGHGRGTSEETSNGLIRVPGTVYPGDVIMEHQNEIDQGHQRAAYQALVQLGNAAHQPMTTPHPMAAHHPLNNLQMQVLGHPPASVSHLFTAPLAQHHQQVLQTQHVLGNVSNLSSLHGLPLGALLAQDHQLRGITPEPMRREDFRKHKDETHEDSACFYTKPTNDLDRFLTEVTPMLQLDASLDVHKALDQLTVEDVWKFYYDCSMLGKEIPLHGNASGKENHCGPCTAYYIPYLSGIQIFTPEDVPYVNDASNIFLCDVEGWPSFMRMQYEQFEVNPPWFRLPLYDMMDELSSHVPELKQLKLKDLHPASWFCVAWYPLYRIPDAPLGTRFLTFHSFHPPRRSTETVDRGGSVPLAVYGLEWYNMLDELWLDNIKICKPIRSPSPSKTNDNSRFEGGDVYSVEQHRWILRIKELRQTAKTFARGLSFRRSTPHGMADVHTHHHDFEYFYERN